MCKVQNKYTNTSTSIRPIIRNPTLMIINVCLYSTLSHQCHARAPIKYRNNINSKNCTSNNGKATDDIKRKLDWNLWPKTPDFLEQVHILKVCLTDLSADGYCPKEGVSTTSCWMIKYMFTKGFHPDSRSRNKASRQGCGPHCFM